MGAGDIEIYYPIVGFLARLDAVELQRIHYAFVL